MSKEAIKARADALHSTLETHIRHAVAGSTDISERYTLQDRVAAIEEWLCLKLAELEEKIAGKAEAVEPD